MPSTRVRFHFILVISFVLTPLHASADTINGCVKQNNGKLRLVADLGQCNNNEAPVSWESEGPQGPEGSDGPQGPAGPQGDPAPAAPAFELVGFTSVTVQGGEGFLGMTSICSAEFPGSRFCTLEEVGTTTTIPPGLNGQAWIWTGDITSVSVGLRVDCYGWSYSGSSNVGLTVDTDGKYIRTFCDATKSVACCAPVE